MLPTDSKARKEIPIYSGFFAYFPRAIAAVAELSRIGNDQHNPGKPLHWDRSKSGDEKDAMLRHLLDQTLLGDAAGDTDGVLHATKKAWRSMADLEKILERPTKFEQYTNPAEDPWVKGYRDWERTTLRFPAGPKVPKP